MAIPGPWPDCSPSAAAAIAAAGWGAEADKNEPLEVIMARLDASKDPRTLLPGDHFFADTSPGLLAAEAARSPCSTFSSQSPPRRRMQASAQVRHPKPFGPSRAVGGSFQSSGQLPHRDLTSWEQEKAVMPERSWGPSAMSCVVKAGMATTSLPASPLRRSAIHDARSSPGSRLREQHWVQLSHDDELLTPVRSSGPPPPQHTSGLARRTAGSAQRGHPGASASSMPPRMDREEAMESQDAEVRMLQEYRRQLATELRQTEQRLAHAELGEETYFSTPAKSGRRRPATSTGASKPPPSAGGPFAGRRGVHDRWNASAAFHDKATAAASSYSYLGPGSDGPPLPDIHPLWS
eukprot:TRINITY_DN84942_c0_g1_i1.p1 TRINITY_DN84942_c0_g1~~TRINITY_DN84942_c0_g1_i1.p1  ORF type:complete len:350 (-),score=42.34 TRINITY_DN84942_c0_g1_i1:50-1099(-)